MRTVTLADVRQLIVDECDLDTPTADTHVTEAMLDRWIHLAASKLTGILTELHGDDWLVWAAEINTTPGQGFVELPDGFFRLKQVWWVRAANDVIALKRAAHEQVTHGANPPTPSFTATWDAAPVYALQGQTLILYPAPSAVYTLRVLYGELFPFGSFDVIGYGTLGPAWEEYLLYDVAARVYQRQEKAAERDYAFARAQDAEQRIRASASGVDENEPRMAGRVYDRRLLREGEQ